MYLGFVVDGARGAALSAASFLLPSFILVLALSWLYTTYGGLPWLAPVFYGVGAAVVGLMIKSGYGLLRRSVSSVFLAAVAALLAIDTIVTGGASFWLLVASGAASAVFFSRMEGEPEEKERIGDVEVKKSDGTKAGPFAFLATAIPAASGGLLGTMFIYFAQASLVVFGSGLAIIPFLYGGLVTQHHWLTDRQFLDSIAVSMITPGPVVIAVVFMGYLIAGVPGALVAALGVFLPIYFITVGAATSFSRIRKNPRVRAFVDGVTAAALGALIGSIVLLGMKSITDLPTLLICAATLALVFRTKIPEPLVIIAAGVAGLLIAGH